MIEAFTHSCLSLDESTDHRLSDDASLMFQNPRTLGRGIDTFDSNGVPQTPVLRISTPFELPAALDDPFDLLAVSPSRIGAAAGSTGNAHSTRRHAAATSVNPSGQLVLIRGGASFTGAHITVRLLSAGYNVRLLAKECNASTAQLKSLVKSFLPSDSPNRLFVFRGDDLAEAMIGCDYVVCNSDPDTADTTSHEEIVQRYLDDVQDLFLSIHKTAAGHNNSSNSASNGMESQSNVRGKIARVIWITTAATVFPVETTSRAKERHLVAAKAIALREAQRIAKKADIPLVVLMPSVVVGEPLTDAKGEALYMIARIARGNRWIPFAPKMYWNFVDVRDVAEAVVAALTCPSAPHQRYIISDCEMKVSEVGRVVQSAFPQLHPPTLDMPNAITLFLSYAGFLGDRDGASFHYLQRNLSRSYPLENLKARRELRMKFRDSQEAIISTVQHMLHISPAPSIASSFGSNSSSPADSAPLSASTSLQNLDEADVTAKGLSRKSSMTGGRADSHTHHRRVCIEAQGSRLAVKKGTFRKRLKLVGALAGISLASLAFGFWYGSRIR